MDKLILKKMAKRFCKGLLESSEASLHFEGPLSDEEIWFIQKEIEKIAARITDERGCITVTHLIEEYYDLGPSTKTGA